MLKYPLSDSSNHTSIITKLMQKQDGKEKH